MRRRDVAQGRQQELKGRQSLLPVDHLVRFGDVPDIDMLITDTAADGGLVTKIEEAGVRVVLA